MNYKKYVEQNKKTLLEWLSHTVKDLRGDLSQSIIAAKGDLSSSTINLIERGIKDPQFTTLFKLAETFEMKLSDFIKCIEKEIPENLTLIDK